MVIEQSVEGVTRWRMIIDDGTVTVRRSREGDGVADVRLTCSEDIARAIASGQRPALDAFINGELRIGGDVGLLLAHRGALESMGNLFAAIRDRTDFERH
jgi:putative sterol carrier protein